MSLVNGVLADLDQRHAANARGADADWLRGLQAAALAEPDRVPRRHAKSVFLGGLIVIGVAFGMHDWIRTPADNELLEPTLVRKLDLPPALPRPSDAILPVPTVAEVTHGTPAVRSDEGPHLKPIVLTDIHVNEVEDETIIELALSAAPEYTLWNSTTPDRIILELRNSQLEPSGVEHPSGDDSLIAGLSTSLVADDTLRLAFEQRRPARLQSATLRKDGDHYRLLIRLTPVPVTPASKQPDEAQPPVAPMSNNPPSSIPLSTSRPEGGEMEKVPLNSAGSNPASEAYSEAVDLYRRGRTAVAEQRLRSALAHAPSHVESRLFLATLLIEQQRATEAQVLLADGLALLPQDPRLAKLSARLLVSAGESQEALAVLLQAMPEMIVDPDYHAFVAAVLQRLERHREAIRVYQGVLTLNAGHAAWWVGLAVSLEAEREHEMALAAFRKARTIQSLDPNLRRYIDNRIAVLHRRKN